MMQVCRCPVRVSMAVAACPHIFYTTHGYTYIPRYLYRVSMKLYTSENLKISRQEYRDGGIEGITKTRILS